MTIITGAAGFIGSALLWYFNTRNEKNIIACDNFGCDNRWLNLRGASFLDFLPIEKLLSFISRHKRKIKTIVHLGACSDTTETDMDFLFKNNVHFSQTLYLQAVKWNINFIYASSAATYGDGKFGYDDNKKNLLLLKPLNKYGFSKQLFDQWIIGQKIKPVKFIGLKFFNVFGPHEYHKGKMASVLFQAHNQFLENGYIRLFKSHKKGIKNGDQKRDFIYIKDVVKMIYFFWEKKPKSGIYNIGSGQPNSFTDLINFYFHALRKVPKIKFINTPKEIRDSYQYFTCASIGKLKTIGYCEPCMSLDKAVEDYVENYLTSDNLYLNK